MRSKLYVVTAALLAAACGDGATGPGANARDESALRFVQLVASAGPATLQASVWAVRGQERRVALVHAGGDAAGSPLFEFVVGPNALLLRPNGQPFLPGDSVLITVTADADRRLRFDLQPSGLGFSPLTPAVMRISYERADPDFNGDGQVNALDAAIEVQLRIWRQEAPGLPWLPEPSIRLTDRPIVEAQIRSFTGFALAS